MNFPKAVKTFDVSSTEVMIMMPRVCDAPS